MGDPTGGATAFDAAVIDEFRANGGRVGGSLAGIMITLVHHVGARSGRERVVPLVCSPQDDGRLVVVASNGGSPTHPAWCHNLRAHPRVTIELGTETFQVVAEELAGDARTEVWARLVAASPSLRQFQERTTRTIPVFALTRTG